MKSNCLFYNQVLHHLLSSAKKNAAKNAFFINGTYYTYAQLYQTVSQIRDALKTLDKNDVNIGLIANGDIETYASIIALWLEGKCYVPINPGTPMERNENILKQAVITTVIDSAEHTLFKNFNVLSSKGLVFKKANLLPADTPDDALAFILFTSGTKGIPKGVPVSRANLAAFIDAFFELGITLNATDKCLQMFELTFDLSVVSYLVPLLKGACIYPVPKNRIKFNYISELLEVHHLTFAMMVPSVLQYLRRYFDEIHCTSMRYNLFAGEALPLDVTAKWANCVPNATIMNVYGPTEHTVFCTNYTYRRNDGEKMQNGIISIGKAMKNNAVIIINEKNKILPPGKKGQLCLAGPQLTTGYWKDEEKNKKAFFNTRYKGKLQRFYKTGDLCVADAEGDIMYLGRMDSQIKIQGFRVELSEIEFFTKAFLKKINAAAVPFTNNIGNTEIGMVIEGDDFVTKPLMNYLKTKMPRYMIPTKIKFLHAFPLNANGKTDRVKMETLFKKSPDA